MIKDLFFVVIIIFNFTTYGICKGSNKQNIIHVNDPNHIIITFGSCNKLKGDENSDIFYSVVDLKPDVFAWLGDAAYLDEPLKIVKEPVTVQKAKKFFNIAKEDPGYQHLLKNTQILGVWDDHDFGVNNGDKSFPLKNEIQQIYLDFLDEPKDSNRRTRKGIYESYYIGEEKKVKLILLDVRYHKDDRAFWGLGWDNHLDMLGEEQWIWLENELKNNVADYVLIGSGLQFLPDDRIFPEYWFDNSRQKLIGLLKQYNINGVILLSGDIHIGEILKLPCWKEKIGYPLYELTSSGLTHYLPRIIHDYWPETYNTNSDRFINLNFGSIFIDFNEQSGSKIALQVRDLNGEVVLEQNLTYLNLTSENYKDTIIDEEKCPLKIPGWKRALINILVRVKNLEWELCMVLLSLIALIYLIVFILKVSAKFILKYLFRPKMKCE